MRSLQLFLFAIDAPLLARSIDAGIDGVIVDWECRGKHVRQAGADTEINAHTLEDLVRVRASTRATVVCRVNAPAERGLAEIEDAIEGGADEVLIPMVRTPGDVERALAVADGRVGVGVLIETAEAVANAAEIGRLPLTRVYLGLNDLAIDRGADSIFTALTDGTVDRVRQSVDVPFGVAGVTDPDCGNPIPCRLLIAELARLEADFTFLRRAFRRDTPAEDAAVTLARIRQASAHAQLRSPQEVEADRTELLDRVRALEGAIPAGRR